MPAGWDVVRDGAEDGVPNPEGLFVYLRNLEYFSR